MSSGLCLSPIPEPFNESEEEGQEHAPSMVPQLQDSGRDSPEQQLYVDDASPERSLEESACVCFFTPRGQLLVVRPAGKIWELRPIDVAETSYDADGRAPLVGPKVTARSVFLLVAPDRVIGRRMGRTRERVWWQYWTGQIFVIGSDCWDWK